MNLDFIGKSIGDIFNGFFGQKKKKQDQPAVRQAPQAAPQAFQQRPQALNRNVVNQGLDQGKSWQQIAAETQTPIQQIKEFSQATRPNYGISPRERAIGLSRQGDALARQQPDYLKATADTIGSFGNDLIKNAQNTASKAYNTVQAPVTGLTGAAMSTLAPQNERQNIINATANQMNRNIGKSFVSPDVARGTSSPLKFAGQFASAGNEVSQYLPIGGLASGAKSGVELGAREAFNQFGKQTLLKNAKQAGVFGTSQTASDIINKRFSPQQTVVNYATPFVLGAGAELGGRAIGSGVNAVPKVTAKVNESVAGVHPAVQAVDQHISDLNTMRNNLSGLGLSENHPSIKANTQAVKDALLTKQELQKHIAQGGYVKVPEKPTVALKDNGVPLEVTNKNTVRGELSVAIPDKEAPIINYLKGVEKQTGQKGLVDQFYYDTGLQRRSNAIANAQVQGSKDLQQAIGGLKGTAKNEFDAYAAARNELSNAERGLPTSAPVSELKSTVKNLTPMYGKRFESLNKFYKDWAGRQRDAGIIDEPTYQQFIANPDYSRIQRDMTDLANPRGKGGNSYSLGSSLTRQKRKGSTRDIQPADITAFNYAQESQKEIQRNQTASNLIDVLEGQGHARKISSTEATRKNTIKRIVNGKTEIYEVPRDIKEIVDNINPYQLGILSRIISAPQRLLRAGATGLSAPFTAANYVKDQASSAILSKSVATTHNPANIMNGIYQAAKDFGVGADDAMWQRFIEHVGDTTQYDFIRNVKNAKDLSREVRLGQTGRVINRGIHPIRTLEDLNQVTEKATRFQNFKGTYEKVLKETGSKEEAQKQATLAAWQNSVDFSRMGNVSQVLNLLIPYFNAGVQGSRTIMRAAKNNPLAFSAKTTAVLGLPLAGVTAWNVSDPERKKVYDNISDYEKQNNILMVLPGATQREDGSYEGVIKIPIQPGMSNLVQPVRIGIENYANSAPADIPQMAQQLIGAISGPINTNSVQGAVGGLVPQVAKPLVQQAANKDFFTGKQIVPDYIEKATDSSGNPVPENKKAFDYTSGSSRMLGDALGVSPIRIDKFIKDTSGKVGQYSQNALDTALAGAGAIPKEQIGGVNVGEDFYRRFGLASGKYNYKKSEGAKYFERVTENTKNLNVNEKAAYTSLHPSKTNFLGDTMNEIDKVYDPAARLDIYNRYPKVFEADKKLDAESQKQGNPGNPLFQLEKWQVKKVLEKDNLPPGAKDPELSKLREQEWYQDYTTKKTDFFNKIKDKITKDYEAAQASGDKKKIKTTKAAYDKFNNPDNPYPVTDPNLQKQMDYYSSLPKGTGERSSWIKSNPGVWQAMQQQFAMVDNWQNIQRGRRGLDMTEGQTGIAAGYGSSGGSGGSRGYGGGSKGKSNYDYTFAPKKANVQKPKKPTVTFKKKGKTAKRTSPSVSIKSSKV